MTIVPGPQLGAGRLRVDAARAIAKLRDYQLTDRTAWVLEGIRGAVAAGATAIVLDGDSNDVWLSWQGPPLSDAELPRLFDELVSPEPASQGHHLRLIATAVNSALGLDPAYIDVVAIPADGPAHRTRYEPGVLVAAGDKLRALAVETVPRPDLPAPGMLVHLRRRAGLETLVHFLRGGRPPELALAVAACRDLKVPIRIAGVTPASDDLARVPLDEGLDGFVAVVPGDARTAVLEVAERGVVLVREAIDLGVGGPLRVFVDAPRMPTNASRSQVRRDAHPIDAAVRRARDLVPALVEQLARGIADGRARAAALALVANAVAGPDWAWGTRELQGPLRRLVELPLVRNAVGELRPIARAWKDVVYVGYKPLPGELAPWLDDMLWLRPGDPAERLVAGAGLDPEPAFRMIRWARRQLRARRRFLEHERREPRVTGGPDPRMRLRLGAALPGSCVQASCFDGLAGEICIHADGTGGELVLLLEGRELDRLRFDAPIGFAAVIDSKDLVPGDRYLGAERDAGFRRIEVALRAGLLRGAEALALAVRGEPLPDGFVAGPPDPETDARLARSAITAPIRTPSPLLRAPLWPALDGERYSFEQLAAHAAIGAATFATLAPPTRVVIRVDARQRELLAAQLAGVQIIDYDRAVASRHGDRARDLGFASAQACLLVREPGFAGAIATASTAKLVVHHGGVRLVAYPYAAKLVSCRISVEVDDAIPSDSWSGVVSDGGAASHDFEPWERAFVRAIAQAVLGEPVDDLFVAANELGLDGPLAGALWAAIASHDPVELLGAALASRLRARRLWSVLGDPFPRSIDELAAAFAAAIPCVDATMRPVAGFAPVIAGRDAAAAIAKLADRIAIDGRAELERRRAVELRASRLAEHRTKAECPIALPAHDIVVELAGGRGVVAVGTGAPTLAILVERRPFQTLRIQVGAPVEAVVDVDESAADATFATLDPAVVERIAAEVRAAVGPLVLAHARSSPASLATPGPVRSLLRASLDEVALDHAARDALRAVAAFPTIQGDRVALASLYGHRWLGRAAWDGPWLPADLAPPETARSAKLDRLDEPVLRVADADAELLAIVGSLLGRAPEPVDDDVKRLQAQRQMARGLLPSPVVPGAAAHLKARLDTLGDLGRELGPGEIALVTQPETTALLHAGGVAKLHVELDVSPTVCVAIEAPELIAEIESLGNLFESQRKALTWKVQELAVRLVRKTVEAGTALPPEIRAGLRRAVMACRFDPAEVGGAAVIETTAGAWLPWTAIDDQVKRFADVWATAPASAAIPLVPERVALRLTDGEIELGRARGLPLVDATQELALDAIARNNRARPLATELALAPDEAAFALGRVALEGPGPRGVVAALLPTAAHRRALRLHHAMHPFDEIYDPCAWPSVAVIDDGRLTPGRTWEGPVDDAVWSEVRARIVEAGEEVWRRMPMVPRDAVAEHRIARATYAGLPSCRHDDLQLRGALWLAEPTATITLVEPHAPQLPRRRDMVAGRIYVHAPSGWLRETAVNDVCVAVYPALLRAAIANRARAPDRVAAHVARALGLGRLAPSQVPDLTFAWGAELLDAGELVARLRGTEAVAFVADGSELGMVIASWLGDRARREVVAVPAPVAPPPAPSPPPPPRHPLQALADDVRARLASLAIGWRGDVAIVARPSPIVRYEHGTIWLGGEHPRLAAIAASPAALDALVAHVVTVLNVALTEITDATEANALGRLLAR